MDCGQGTDSLERYVLGGCTEAETIAVETHLARCGACRHDVEELRLLLCEIRLESSPTIPRPEFARSLAATLHRETAVQRHGARWRGFAKVAGLAVAATALLAVGLYLTRPAGQQAPPASDQVPLAQEPSARELWRYAGATASPASAADDVVVAGQSLYVLCGEEVSAVSRGTGHRRWHWQGRAVGYLAANDRHVFCLARTDRGAVELVALSGPRGHVLWRDCPEDQPAAAQATAPVALGPDRLCWSHGRTVSMLRASDGRRLWERPIEAGGILSRPAVAGENLFVGTGRAVYCLATATGRTQWSRSLGGETVARSRRPLLAVGGGKLYVVQRSMGPRGRLLCVDLARQQAEWDRPVRGVHSLVAGPEGAYVRGGRIEAFDPTGRARWQRDGQGCGPLALSEGELYFVDTRQKGLLIGLNRRTGQAAWQVRGVRSCDAFARVGQSGYIKTQDGAVLALTLLAARGM